MKKAWILSPVVFVILAACSSTSEVATQASGLPNNVVEANRISDYRVFVYIEGTSPKVPVRGTRVFDNTSNRLLGITNANGIATISVIVGQKIRIVEPGYGMQQSLIIVKARPNVSLQSVSVDEETSWRCCR